MHVFDVWEFEVKTVPQKFVFLQVQQQQQSFYGPLSGTTPVRWYQKKHSPTHHPDHHPIHNYK